MIEPSSSLLNFYKSIEKFLWSGVASEASVPLINQDDLTTRLQELTSAKKAVIWRVGSGAAGNTGVMTIFAGATTIEDPGHLIQIGLFDKVKAAVDQAASIVVYDYLNNATTTKVNELAFVGRVSLWPVINEPNGFTTRLLSTKVMFAQKRI